MLTRVEDCCNFLFKGHHNLHVRYTNAMHKLHAATARLLAKVPFAVVQEESYREFKFGYTC